MKLSNCHVVIAKFTIAVGIDGVFSGLSLGAENEVFSRLEVASTEHCKARSGRKYATEMHSEGKLMAARERLNN